MIQASQDFTTYGGVAKRERGALQRRYRVGSTPTAALEFNEAGNTYGEVALTVRQQS